MLVDYKRYPCDDDYEDKSTGRTINVKSTMAAHFSMPVVINSLKELAERNGVHVKKSDLELEAKQ